MDNQGRHGSNDTEQSSSLAAYNTNTATLSSSCSPQRPFPPVMNAYYHFGLSGLKTFYLCGAEQNDRLCAVEMHTGYSGKPPLGARPGIHLHAGASTKDAVLAATGDESMASARLYALNNSSVVLLPPLGWEQNNSRQMVNEPMHARSTGKHVGEGGSGGRDEESVVFLFSVEVGKKLRREHFEWTRIQKDDNAMDGVDVKAGGFKLLRLSPRFSEQGSSSGGSGPSDLKDGVEGEVVAVLAFTKMWSSLKHIFSLHLRGSGLALGERWTLMVVATALRLWSLKTQGRTGKAVVTAGEKLRGT